MAAFVDARRLEAREPLQADVCIVGAGAAGITLALRLAEQGRSVLVLESGGERIDGPTQSLYHCAQSGVPYYDLTACRLRFLGGTTNHWGGYCRPNDAIDYAGRPELGVPAWPLTAAQMQPYLMQAAARLGLEAEGFDPRWQLQRLKLPADQLLDDRSTVLQSKVFQITRRRRFRELHADELRTQPLIRPLLNANVVHVQLDAGGRHVSHLKVRTLGGGEFEARAHHYVLAAHAVENARLLLSSDDVQAGGIGNLSDQVGRNFMEHPHLHSGLLFPSEAFPRLYEAGRIGKTWLNINLGLSEPAMRKLGVLQYYCRFRPLVAPRETSDALRTLRTGFWKPADLKAIDALSTLLTDVPASARFVAARWAPTRVPPLAYELDHRIEQSPNPHSRVTLGNERDALGMRKLQFHWDLNELDVHSFAEGQRMIVEEFTRLGLGRFETTPIDAELVRERVRGHYHHMGTARMADSPRDGVVDRDCKVHGVDNLFVAGSAVFPTAGYSGPTMTLIALALRLAEHLGERAKLT